MERMSELSAAKGQMWLVLTGECYLDEFGILIPPPQTKLGRNVDDVPELVFLA
jgi:hypothetical protein